MIYEKMRKNSSVEDVLGSKARIKILLLLAKNEELNISQIISKTRLNHSSIVKHLNALKDMGLIQEKIFGRIKIYRFKIENIKARSLKNFLQIWENNY